MIRLKQLSTKLLANLLVTVLTVSALPLGVFAEETTYTSYELTASLNSSISMSIMGTYNLTGSTVTSASVVGDGSGTAYLTLKLGTSSGKIMTSKYVSFVDASSSTPGYYDANGERQDAKYTLSNETATNTNGESVNYVDSMTFPITEASDTYYLYIYVNSNSRKVQFSNGTDTEYTSKLSVTWTDEAKSVFDIVETPDDEDNTADGENQGGGDGDSDSGTNDSTGEGDTAGGGTDSGTGSSPDSGDTGSTGDGNTAGDDNQTGEGDESDDETDDSTPDRELPKDITYDMTITYEYYPEPTYEISIPSRLDIPSDTNGALSYKITLDSATHFAETDYITISTPLDGTLKSDTHSVAFANALDNTHLTKAGDNLTGKLLVNTPEASGVYKGTVSFTIEFHSNSEY